jgi:hypothetical protein
MNDYPVGTECVITNSTPHGARKLGDVVVCTQPGFVWRSGEIAPNGGLVLGEVGDNLLVVQPIGTTSQGMHLCWPVDWMRPIDKDTGPDDDAVVEAYKATPGAIRYEPIVIADGLLGLLVVQFFE